MSTSPVVILGAGIAGTLTACMLADRGMDAVLVDRNRLPMEGASRWNEGKIHLGFTYVGTESLDTARLMIAGADAFVPRIERVLGSSIPAPWFSEPVIYLVDQASLVPAEVLWRRSLAVAGLLGGAVPMGRSPSAAVAQGPTGLRRLDPDEAMERTRQKGVVAAWESPERAVSPRLLAQAIQAATARRGIRLHQGEITGVRRDGAVWHVSTSTGPVRAHNVVNCSWESRSTLDHPVAQPVAPSSVRFKYGLFGRGLSRLQDLAPSTRILGRFGDVTPYGNGDAYLSWYPAGLALLSDGGPVPPPPGVPPDLQARTLAGLGLSADLLEPGSAEWEARGGYVVAHGSGDIDRIDSPLHDRSRPGIHELAPGYWSVDTGKWSLGPMLAAAAASKVAERLGAALELET